MQKEIKLGDWITTTHHARTFDLVQLFYIEAIRGNHKKSEFLCHGVWLPLTKHHRRVDPQEVKSFPFKAGDIFHKHGKKNPFKITDESTITKDEVLALDMDFNTIKKVKRNQIRHINRKIPKPIDTTTKDLTIRELQTKLPWTIRYSQDFRSSPVTHKDFSHAMHHVSKAAGKLHGLADDMDHDRSLADSKSIQTEYGKYVADLVVSALRAANTFPGGVLDLQQAVQDRIEDKNGVKL